MDIKTGLAWPCALEDPTDRRSGKPRQSGLTMVIDKGLGPSAFEDLLLTAGEYIDLLKFGFGTSPLYPLDLLRSKIALAKRHRVATFPGGTLLEAAYRLEVVAPYLDMAADLGFDGVEVSDGTIELSRRRRDELITEATQRGLRVFTEYGKKQAGSRIVTDDLRRTVELDLARGAELVTVEARESGIDVGLFDENGRCREEELQLLRRSLPEPDCLLWEAPQKEQQVSLLRILGTRVNLGNISPGDVLSLETLRRGLRSDTFALHPLVSDYMI
ncbi:phosphosulfolactate synthase [Cohnella fermenti]|uniref:Phosphosulfolactate synthase n=1 Tax=Cohnella fermenti TaxID=2565925 RepID=A0A4S4BM84_9BACL|nr:phosphosulfolactate synthase [Cohnella fermenti]THF75915.1 phosphosulfolactate synthase [Cohnella fermenti]